VNEHQSVNVTLTGAKESVNTLLLLLLNSLQESKYGVVVNVVADSGEVNRAASVEVNW